MGSSMRALLCLLRASGSIALAVLALLLFVIGLGVTPAGLLLEAALLAPWRARAAALGRARIAMGACVLALGLAFPGYPFVEGARRIEELSAKLPGGPGAFTSRELASIYALNVTMALGGVLVGAPEAAEETLLLAVPGPPERVFHSDMPMRSWKVRRAVAAMLREAESGAPGQALGPRRVAWRYSPSESLRAALALNALTLRAAVVEPGRRARIELEGTVAVRYPPRAGFPSAPCADSGCSSRRGSSGCCRSAAGSTPTAPCGAGRWRPTIPGSTSSTSPCATCASACCSRAGRCEPVAVSRSPRARLSRPSSRGC